MKLRVAVTGKNGQVGQSLQEIAVDFQDYDLTFWGRSEWDITNPKQTKKIIEDGQYDVLINAAAYTSVDLAEEEVDLCHQVNHHALNSIVKSCNAAGTHLIHLSSDYVYDNDLNRPLKTTDPCLPKGQYALSKLLGEQVICSNSESAYIVRTSWIYSSFGHNFVKTMLRLATQHKKLSIVQDQWGCPTSAHILAFDLLNGLSRLKTDQGVKIFNYTQAGFTNWYELALEIFRLTDQSISVIPINSKDFPTKARRPKFSILNCEEFVDAFQMNRLHWKDALKRCLAKIDLD